MTSENLNLKVKTRPETGKKVSQLREQGKIPAVLYGHKIKTINLVVDYIVFEKIYKQSGDSTLIDLEVDENKPVKVLVQDYQLDPRTDQFIHVDFHQVRMDEKIHAEVALEFFGEPQAVKELSGVLVTNLNSLECECLPKDLVHEIKVDLSILNTFDDSIHVKDIKAPEGITIMNVPDDVIALVQPPRTEKEMEALEEKVEGEVVEGETAEGETGEGETTEGGKPTETETPKTDKDAKDGKINKKEN